MLSWCSSLLPLCVLASRISADTRVTTTLLPRDSSPFSNSRMLGFMDDGSPFNCFGTSTAAFSGSLFGCAPVGETVHSIDTTCNVGGTPSTGGLTWSLYQTAPATRASPSTSSSQVTTITTPSAQFSSTFSQSLNTTTACRASTTSTSPSNSAAAAPAVAGFDAGSTQNVAVYWGQNSGNAGQERLASYCDDTNVNIINVAFITGMTPVIVNFASAGGKCTQSVNNAGLLLCKDIEEDIKSCQKKGKTILLSMGGAAPTASDWNGTADAEKSAQLIWDMFGPVPAGKIDRPFGSAVVDGFDFDFESPVKNLPAFGGKLRRLMDAATDKKFFFSAAPQCVTPDANIGTTLDAVPFDFVQVQFYNNPCGVNQFQEGTSDQVVFNFAVWDAWAEKSENPSVKVFLGIPASPAAAGQGSYTDGSKLKAALNWAKKYRSFGGVMIWDVAQLYANRNFLPEVVSALQDGNQPYPNRTFASTATPITSPRLSSPSLISSSPLISSSLNSPSSPSSTSPPGSSPPVSSPSSPSGVAITQWGQCGGQGYTGPTQCQPPYRCVSYSPWWSDCR